MGGYKVFPGNTIAICKNQVVTFALFDSPVKYCLAAIALVRMPDMRDIESRRAF